ncbi:MFS transporter [Kyrpidia tusciae]|uniref:Major facilitator superfamily MFS_1 n=1 Tax=Kyrpidia tusciae (strain DSM 2912 / NBRC 15312 / T2) TaxID=562970 RepID=D5WTH4_KYRT2|nr:MFS transporter [Kyrpidia tusciae]ADG07210.1 major facilitator superfamily MFS_1 [Kyrpidia tusciae DSM 2912]
MSTQHESTHPGMSIERVTHYRFVVAAVLFVTLLIAYLDRVNVSVLVADRQFLQDMDMIGNAVRIGLLNTAFLLTYGIANIVLGRVGERVGAKTAMLIAVAIWVVAMALGGAATGFAMIMSTRILLGIGEGLHWPMQSIIVTHWFPESERTKANAAWLLGLFVGPMIAAPSFVYIISHWGWRSNFFVLSVLNVLAILLIAWFVNARPSQSRFVGASERAYIEGGGQGAPAAQTDVAHHSAVENYLTDYRFWFLTVAYMSSQSIFFGLTAWLPKYLQEIRGFSFSSLGVFASLPYMVAVVFLVVFGYLADRVKRRAPFIAAGLTSASVFIWGAAVVTDNRMSAYFLSLGVGSLGIGLSSYWSILQRMVRRSVIGAAAGVMNGVGMIFTALVPTIIGYFIKWSGGSYNGGLFFLVALGLLGALLMAVLSLRKE